MERVDQLEPSVQTEGYDLAPNEDSVEKPRGFLFFYILLV